MIFQKISKFAAGLSLVNAVDLFSEWQNIFENCHDLEETDTFWTDVKMTNVISLGSSLKSRAQYTQVDRQFCYAQQSRSFFAERECCSALKITGSEGGLKKQNGNWKSHKMEGLFESQDYLEMTNYQDQ